MSIVFRPGMRVIDPHYRPIDLPDYQGWESRAGVVTRIDHPDKRFVYVRWDGRDDEIPAFLADLEPEDWGQVLRMFCGTYYAPISELVRSVSDVSESGELRAEQRPEPEGEEDGPPPESFWQASEPDAA